MTATETTSRPAPAATTRVRAWLRRQRATLVVTGGMVLAVLVVILGTGAPGTTEPLDPDNAGPTGARAIARVLDAEGIDVSIARGADALRRAGAGPGVTVVVTSVESLGTTTAQRLRADVRGADLVLVGPGTATTDLFDLEASPFAVRRLQERDAECASLGLEPGLTVAADRALAYDTAAGCFPVEQGHLVGVVDGGPVLLGAGDILQNEQILREDNAAVALRLLGGNERLVWYVPQVEDLVGEDAVGLMSLLPAWLRPALLLSILVTGAVLLWRGRRLGRLEVEPLPVTVRSIESTRSRGRLYRKGNDRDHAASALRRAARSRLAEALRLPVTTAPPILIREVARHLGRPVAEVEAVLAPWAPAPTTDDDLVRLATTLATMTREVHP